MSDARIAAVICSWNKKEYLRGALDSLLESVHADLTVIVADNASEDGSAAMVLEEYHALPVRMAENAPERMRTVSTDGIIPVVLVQNETNLGGSGGFNAGLRYALKETDAPYIFLMDDDAAVDENALMNLAAFLDSHPDYGMACARVDNLEDPDTVQQYGTFISFEDCSVHSPYAGHPEDGTLPPDVTCDAVPACALMVRRSVIESIGLMPEENFLYWDDTDWCTRCRMAGFNVAAVGSAIALHRMGAKREVTTTFPVYYSWRNRIRYFMTYTGTAADPLLRSPKELPARRKKMAHVLLSEWFAEYYTAFYNEETMQMETLTGALSDALHAVTGRADPALIGPVTHAKEHAREELLRHDSRQVRECPSVLLCSDLSGQYIWHDEEGNLLTDDSDLLKVLSYQSARSAFLSGMEPLVVRQMKQPASGRFAD